MSVFTFGQTSSGKTYTMKGIGADEGLVPLSLRRLFDKLDKKKDCMYRLTMSYYEIYNEQINDLLDRQNKNQEIRENREGTVFIGGISKHEIKNSEEALKLFIFGETERVYATTKMNHKSSRSHVIQQIHVETRFKNKVNKTYYSNFLLADLGGSEGMKICGDNGKKSNKEGANINKSLSALTNVIMKLEKKAQYIPYRDSKLTRILQPILSGNCKTNVICTLNCEDVHYSESFNTIRFGLWAGGVKLSIKEHVVEEEHFLNKEEAQKIGELTEINKQQESEIFLLKKTIDCKDIEITDKQAKLCVQLKEKQMLERELDSYKNVLKDTQARNEELCDDLRYLSQRKEAEVEEKYKDGIDQMMCKIEDVGRKLGKYENIAEKENLTRRDYNRLDDHDKSLTLTSVPFFRKKKPMTTSTSNLQNIEVNNEQKTDEFLENNANNSNNKVGTGIKMIIENEVIGDIDLFALDKNLSNNKIINDTQCFNDIGLDYYNNSQNKNNEQTKIIDSSYHNKMLDFFDNNTKKNNSNQDRFNITANFMNVEDEFQDNPFGCGDYCLENNISSNKNNLSCIQKMQEELNLADESLTTKQNIYLLDNNNHQKSLVEKRIGYYQYLENENKYQQNISDLERENRFLKERVEHCSKKYEKLEAEVLANVDNHRFGNKKIHNNDRSISPIPCMFYNN